MIPFDQHVTSRIYSDDISAIPLIPFDWSSLSPLVFATTPPSQMPEPLKMPPTHPPVKDMELTEAEKKLQCAKTLIDFFKEVLQKSGIETTEIVPSKKIKRHVHFGPVDYLGPNLRDSAKRRRVSLAMDSAKKSAKEPTGPKRKQNKNKTRVS
jgi:hypothetical protein